HARPGGARRWARGRRRGPRSRSIGRTTGWWPPPRPPGARSARRKAPPARHAAGSRGGCGHRDARPTNDRPPKGAPPGPAGGLAPVAPGLAVVVLAVAVVVSGRRRRDTPVA